jgi:hypothetical protein
MNDLAEQKLLEELKALRRPWYRKPDQWAAYIAVLCTLAGVGFQYSLHDQNLLIAKNEKSLAEQEKLKAENERFVAIKERIKIEEKLSELRSQLKTLVEGHNKVLAAESPISPEAKALIAANLQFLAQIEKQVAVVSASIPTSQREIHYFSWIDSLLSTLLSLGAFVIGVIFLYSFLSKKHPDLFPTLVEAIKSNTRTKSPSNDA